MERTKLETKQRYRGLSSEYCFQATITVDHLPHTVTPVQYPI